MLRAGLMCIDSKYNFRKWPWPIAGVRYKGQSNGQSQITVINPKK